jgi:hypothetical protein
MSLFACQGSHYSDPGIEDKLQTWLQFFLLMLLGQKPLNNMIWSVSIMTDP